MEWLVGTICARKLEMMPEPVLRPLADDIWLAEADNVLLGANIGARSTIIRLQNGDLWVHSPLDLTPSLRESVEELGPVRHLIAPNVFHYKLLPQWAEAFPDALVWVAPGVKPMSGVLRHAELGNVAHQAWRDDLEQVMFRGGYREVVFFHAQSRTLITTDLVQNLPSERGLGTQILATLEDTRDHVAVPRIVRLASRTERALAKASAERILEWDFERVVLAHGNMVENNARNVLKRAFEVLGV